MPIVMIERWDGIDAEKYEEIRKLAKWDTDTPKGLLLHIASFADGNAHMVDVWDSPDDFQRFVAERIMPAVQQLGIAGQPDVQIYPTHAILNPGRL